MPQGILAAHIAKGGHGFIRRGRVGLGQDHLLAVHAGIKAVHGPGGGISPGIIAFFGQLPPVGHGTEQLPPGGRSQNRLAAGTVYAQIHQLVGFVIAFLAASRRAAAVMRGGIQIQVAHSKAAHHFIIAVHGGKADLRGAVFGKGRAGIAHKGVIAAIGVAPAGGGVRGISLVRF